MRHTHVSGSMAFIADIIAIALIVGEIWKTRGKSTPSEVIPSITLTGTKFVNRYDNINLTCNATGALRAPDDVDWFHDGHVIHSHQKKWNSRLKILNYTPEVPGKSLISNLIIDKSSFGDAGRYVCRSSNKEMIYVDVIVLNTENPRDPRETETDTVVQIKPNGNYGHLMKASKVVLIVLLMIAVNIR